MPPTKNASAPSRIEPVDDLSELAPDGRFALGRTARHVPKQYLGETAARRMAQIIETRSYTPVKTEVSTTLVKRRSV